MAQPGLQLIAVTLVGTRPLLLDHMGLEDLLSLGSGERLSYEEQCRRHLSVDAQGKPVLPASYLMASLRAAGREVKVGRVKVSTKTGTILPSFLTPVGEEFLIKPGEWQMDNRQARKDGKPVRAIRPRFDRWEVEAMFAFTPRDGLDSSTAMLLFEIAGHKIGVGAFRRELFGERRGTFFGQFRIKDWEVVDV